MGPHINIWNVTSDIKGSAPELVKRETDTRVMCMVDALKHSETLCAITINDKVVQDERQRVDNDLQDERQDQPKEEEVEPRRSKKARTEKSFGPYFVSFMVENEPTSYQEAWPEWDPFRARISDNRDCCSDLTSADVSIARLMFRYLSELFLLPRLLVLPRRFLLLVAFDVFCEKFHIPEEVHPVLPDRDSTIHERYFRINISQLFVIGVAKVSHFEILCRVCGDTSTVASGFSQKLELPFLWVDEFAWHARFSWHTAKNMTRDPALKATDFSAQDYVILDGEGMDIFAFICTPDPTKVKVVERERHEVEPRLLEVTVGRTVLLLPVAPDCGESELSASVDKQFDEGGSGTQVEQEDSVGGGDGRDTNVQPAATAVDTISEEVVSLQPRRHRKRKPVVVDTGGPSHPPKKLREDYEAPVGPFVSGKSRSVVQRLLVEAVLNAEVRG
ncbi:hypothetical protein Tco_0648880 [Tanacetum coccineum]